jgi:acetyl esterase
MRTEERFSWNGIDAGVTILHPDDGTEGRERPLSHALVLYLHGGGLLLGTRSDLPEAYENMFLDRGCTLVEADYPLAPESPLHVIHGFVDALWDWVSGELSPRLGCDSVFLFGRSSGAYLVLTLAGRLAEADGACRPTGVIDFYGYGNSTDPSITAPSETYRAYPTIGSRVVDRVKQPEPVTCGPAERRFALYMYARQTGRWASLLGLDEGTQDPFALTEQQIDAMPPVFYAAATGDGEIPYATSKSLARKLHAQMFASYGNDHEFDRDTGNPDGRRAYERCLSWMEGLV